MRERKEWGNPRKLARNGGIRENLQVFLNVGTHPKLDVRVHRHRVSDPAALGDVVPGRRVDRAVWPAPVHSGAELGDQDRHVDILGRVHVRVVGLRPEV